MFETVVFFKQYVITVNDAAPIASL